MNIPLFSYNSTSDSSFIFQWENYLDEYFLVETNHCHYSAVDKALEYNLSNINPILNNEEIITWSKLIGSYAIHGYVGISGKYLRSLYEHSDKTIDTANIIDIHLERCSDDEDIIDFLSLIRDDYSIFNNFYIQHPMSVLGLFLENFANVNDVFKKPKYAYLARYIYTPMFIEKFTDIKLPETSFMLKSHYLLDEWELTKQHIFKSIEQQLGFIISVLYTTPDILDIQTPQNLLDLKNNILSLFENDFPEQYAQYQTLKSLELELSPTALSNQLTTSLQIQPVELPTFG